MKQESLSDMEYSCQKETKREEFLEIMDEIIPCCLGQSRPLRRGDAITRNRPSVWHRAYAQHPCYNQ